MLSENINFKNFNIKKKSKVIEKIFKDIKKKFLEKSDPILNSLTKEYKNSFSKSQLKKIKKYYFYNLIGMGGSSLGAKGIYSFLREKIKKEFNFIDNIKLKPIPISKNTLNIIISKSGNTLETVTNFNTINKKKKFNFFNRKEKQLSFKNC